jgi:hypothetical protein
VRGFALFVDGGLMKRRSGGYINLGLSGGGRGGNNRQGEKLKFVVWKCLLFSCPKCAFILKLLEWSVYNMVIYVNAVTIVVLRLN